MAKVRVRVGVSCHFNGPLWPGSYNNDDDNNNKISYKRVDDVAALVVNQPTTYKISYRNFCFNFEVEKEISKCLQSNKKKQTNCDLHKFKMK